MGQIGLYRQLTDFTTEHAGTAEWCKAERDGRLYFVKKFQSPIYPSRDIGIPDVMYKAGVLEFKQALADKNKLYSRLRECDRSGILVVPVEVIGYQFHICTIAELISANVSPEQVCLLSEWQRMLLLRTLTLALMNVHQAGVVHSDMKPDNILIFQDEKGFCKLRLIDFDGSFFEEKPPEDPEEVVGDPAFFAPEAYRQTVEEGVRLDHRMDVFALGIIFHYFWCGKYPQKPSNQTIGEFVLRGGTVVCDASVPLVLSQLIHRMLAVDPARRIELKTVYDVLGIQLDRIAPKVVNLQRARNNSSDAPGPKQVAEVTVNYYSEGGDRLKYRTYKVGYGSKLQVEAEDIEGYRLVSRRFKTLEVDARGNVVKPVSFNYQETTGAPAAKDEKKRGDTPAKKAVLTIFALFLAYWLLMYGLSEFSYRDGRYEQAQTFMKLTPFFRTLFPNEYRENNDKLYSLRNRKDVDVYDIGMYDRNDSVRQIQDRLSELRYLDDLNAAEANGVFGAQTRDAVAAFQRKNGIHGNNKSYGVVTTMTSERLFSDDALPSYQGKKIFSWTIDSSPLIIWNDHTVRKEGSQYCLHFRCQNNNDSQPIIAMVIRWWTVDSDGEIVRNRHGTLSAQSWIRNYADLVPAGPNVTQGLSWVIPGYFSMSQAATLRWAVVEVVYGNGEVYMNYDASAPWYDVPYSSTPIR